MSENTQQYFDLYRQYRYEDQRSFYEKRQKEFEAARDEVIWLTAVLMVLTAGVSALAAANIGGLHVLWSILAVALPSFSTALAAYNGLYAFERQAKLYGDAANALLRADADSPDPKVSVDDAVFAAAVIAHVQQVEQILGGEQAQWGQLIGEIKPVTPPETKPEQEQPPGG
jgi:hypothetical protein